MTDVDMLLVDFGVDKPSPSGVSVRCLRFPLLFDDFRDLFFLGFGTWSAWLGTLSVVMEASSGVPVIFGGKGKVSGVQA